MPVMFSRIGTGLAVDSYLARQFRDRLASRLDDCMAMFALPTLDQSIPAIGTHDQGNGYDQLRLRPPWQYLILAWRNLRLARIVTSLEWLTGLLISRSAHELRVRPRIQCLVRLCSSVLRLLSRPMPVIAVDVPPLSASQFRPMLAVLLTVLLPRATRPFPLQ